MPVVLEKARALDAGDVLWIISYDPTSFWYQRLNWLTNFCLTANEVHSKPKVNPWLIRILETCEIPVPEIPKFDPLLVPVSQWLPAEWLVTIPWVPSDAEQFIQTISHIWNQFQQPSLRLFVPASISLQRWEELWSRQNLPNHVSLVFDT